MLRELKEKDRAIFLQMVNDFYNSDAVLHSIPMSNIEKTFKEVMSNSPFTKAYIIEEKEQIAGYGLLSLTYSNEVGGMVVWIEELYIQKEFRGLGLGSIFLDFVKEKYGKQAKRLRLELEPNNTSAENLYLRKGYKQLDYKQMVNDDLLKK